MAIADRPRGVLRHLWVMLSDLPLSTGTRFLLRPPQQGRVVLVHFVEDGPDPRQEVQPVGRPGMENTLLRRGVVESTQLTNECDDAPTQWLVDHPISFQVDAERALMPLRVRADAE